MSFVLQSWVSDVGLKMQSIMISGLRAPDAFAPNVKKCVRWMRSKCQIDADPQKQSYMKTIDMSREIVDLALDECEYLTCHYVHHLADSFRVLSVFHPDGEVRELAFYLHNLVAEEVFHFIPESTEQFLEWHKDKRSAIVAD